jgi:cytosine/adenosine deaminase-related metal-dependent hydrolase
MPILTAQWVLPVSAPPISNGFVAFEAGRIAAVGPLGDLPDSQALPTPKPGSILTPGLVNTHAHLEQSFPQPILKNPTQPFTDWLLAVIAETRAHGEAEARTQRCKMGASELLRTGTTCVNDIASSPESLHVLDTMGLRGIVSLECFHPGFEADPGSDFESDPSTFQGVRNIADAYRRFRQGYEAHPRLQAGLSPHSPYNVSPAAWRALLEACAPPLIHTHVAEFEDEVRYLQGRESAVSALHERVLGKRFYPQSLAESPVQYLQAWHLLNPRTVLAHCVHTNAADRAILRQSGAAIAHCPRSNVALHGQTLRHTDWQDAGIPMGLGTDGRLSTEDLDLRAEARFAMSQHGWPARQTLEMLTTHGASVLGLRSTIGSLELAKWADIVLWQAASNVTSSPEEALLSASTEVEQVYIEGHRLWQKDNGAFNTPFSFMKSVVMPPEATHV